jgi:hypothetical protein
MMFEKGMKVYDINRGFSFEPLTIEEIKILNLE